MPYYEYECRECGKVFSIFQHMDEKHLQHYTHELKNFKLYPGICNGPVERRISVPSLKFVGKGFHINDYPKDGSR
jgi:predicted nucleic acid-binding Zn ribbon protein